MMKKILILWISLILFGCSYSADTQVEYQDTFVVGMECNYAPFNWMDVDANDTNAKTADGGYCDGYDVQIAKKIAQSLQKELVIRNLEWDSLEPSLNSNSIDAIIAGMSATEERRKNADFTDPYYTSDMVMIVRKDSVYANATSLEDFRGATVQGQLNTMYDEIIDQIPEVNHAQPLESYSYLIAGLLSGSVDALTAETPVALGAVATQPSLSIVHFEKGKGFQIDPSQTSVSIGVKKGNSDLLAGIQKALNTISEEERIQLMEEATSRQPAQIEDAGNLLQDSWSIFMKYKDLFIKGIINTLIVAFVGTIVGLCIGLFVGGIRFITGKSDLHERRFFHKIIYTITSIYVEVFRGTPMLVQAMFLHFTIFNPMFHWSGMQSAMVIISMNTGAYMAEIIRSGIQAVDKGQTEAARSIGMNSIQTMFYIVLPQAIKNSFPSIGNEFVVNVKDSCVLNSITFSELFLVAVKVQGATFSYAEPFFIVAIIYFILTFTTTRILGMLEYRLNHKKSSYPASVSDHDMNVLK